MRNKIYIVAAVGGVLVAAILVGELWSGYRIGRAERDAAEARSMAEVLERSAADAELKAAEYKQKTEYLERSLEHIRATARKQDEELEKIDVDVRGARADVERTRRVRAVSTTADELCRQLGEIGYPCGGK